MFTQSVALAALGVAGGVGIGLGVSFWRRRKARRRTKRREQLRIVGRRHGFDLIGAGRASTLLDAATRFRGDDHEIELDDVMLGNDREGRSWFARRKVQGSSHSVYGFEIRGELNVRGLHIEPHSGEAPIPRWKRPFTKTTTKSRLRLSLRWDCEAKRMTDELTRRAVDRWVDEIAKTCSPEGRVPVGLEVHGEHAWVHSLVPLEGVAFNEFARRSQEIRRMVLDEVRRRPATLATPAVRKSAKDQDAEQQAEQDTRPLFPVPGSAEAMRNEDKTVLLSAVDLLREVPDPRSRKRRVNGSSGGFEIPEPEEKVTLIQPR